MNNIVYLVDICNYPEYDTPSTLGIFTSKKEAFDKAVIKIKEIMIKNGASEDRIENEINWLLETDGCLYCAIYEYTLDKVYSIIY